MPQYRRGGREEARARARTRMRTRVRTGCEDEDGVE